LISTNVLRSPCQRPLELLVSLGLCRLLYEVVNLTWHELWEGATREPNGCEI